MEQPFNYEFAADSLEDRLLLMNGYLQGIKEVFSYLQSVTQYNPANRFIDVIPLVEKIGVTCEEIAQLQTDYNTELSLLQLFKNDL